MEVGAELELQGMKIEVASVRDTGSSRLPEATKIAMQV